MSVWDDIKVRLQVEDIISEYIPVIPAGANFKCVCPFHQERTPSMVVSPAKQIWHCFGCGAGGDVFKFVMEYENLSKQDTLKKLAKKAGVKLEDIVVSGEKQLEKSIEVSHLEKGYKTLDWSASLYHSVLKKIMKDRGHVVTQYCLKRGLSEQTIDQFKIGYAPKGNFLKVLAKKYGVDEVLLEQISVLKRAESGVVRDKFSDRITIPIFDTQDRVVGFTGRVLPYDKTDRPKYLNTSETDWFHKSQIWYGLNFSRKAILQHKYAILVEGNMDVIAAHQTGLDMCIASQGTSFTSEQLSLLKRYTSNIQVAFDNDNAGKIAGRKLFLEASRIGFYVEKIIIPEQFKDLDDYIRSESFEIQDIERRPFIDNYIDFVKKAELQSTVSKTQKDAIIDVIELLVYFDTLESEQYLGKLSAITQISTTTLGQLLQEKRATSHPKTTTHSIEQEVINHINSEKLKSAPVYLAFQQLCAQQLHSSSSHNLELIFTLIAPIIPQFSQTDTLEGFMQDSKDELEFILSEKGELDPNTSHLLNQTIMTFIDTHISQLSLNPDAQDAYMKLKMMST